MEEVNIITALINLGPTGIFGFIAFKLWQSYQEELKYSKEQNIENLKTFNSVINMLDLLKDKQGTNDLITHELLKEIKLLFETRIESLSSKIDNRK